MLTVLIRNRRCPWRCIYCDLWKESLDYSVPVGAIPAQIDVATGSRASSGARQLKLYNAGSFFDRAAIPPADHLPIAERARRFERVIVESHPSLVGDSAIRFRDLLASCELEVAMGLEIADDAILQKLNKRMTTASFAKAAKFLLRHGIALRAFVIVKPPFVSSDEEAIAAAERSARFAFECGATVVSLIPARFGTDVLNDLAEEGNFAPPKLGTIERVMDSAMVSSHGRVFVDLWNITKAGSCDRCFSPRLNRLREMNLKQQIMPRITCACDSRSR